MSLVEDLLREEIKKLKAEKENMRWRNHLLRTRPDLPLARIVEYELLMRMRCVHCHKEAFIGDSERAWGEDIAEGGDVGGSEHPVG